MKHIKLLLKTLDGVDFTNADLSGADLLWVNMRNTDFRNTKLFGAKVMYASVDGSTRIAEYDPSSITIYSSSIGSDMIDDETDFTGVVLSSLLIDPLFRTKLERNICRKYWMRWYGQHRILQYHIRLFWWLSDYGTTGTRCIGAFVLLIIAAFITYFWITGIAITSSPKLFTDTILAAFGFGSLYDQLTGPIRLLLTALR